MNLDTARTVADLASESPARALVFERFKIDYCCGGRRSLVDACAAQGADLGAVLSALRAVDAEPASAREVRWAERPLEDLMAHIEATHHEFTYAELTRAQGLAERVRAAHGAAHPELLAALRTLDELSDELVPHMAREERVLFPFVRALAAGRGGAVPLPSVAMPIMAMEAQHDVAGALLAQLRAETRDYALPDDACPTWRALWHSLRSLEADLHQHIHLENNVLHPRALALEAAQRG